MVDSSISSHKALARIAGINEDTFDNLFKKDRKKSMYADDLLLVSNALGVSMEELLTGEEPEEKPVEFNNPIIGELCSTMERLDDNQLVELRGAIEMYIRTRFIAGRAADSERGPREAANE